MRISDWSSDVCSSDLRAQARLVERQRLGDAVAHRARLTGEAAALHRADDVELIAAVGDQERLGEDHAQHRPGEVDRLVLAVHGDLAGARRSEEHTSELQSLMRISYAVFCLKKKKKQKRTQNRKKN